MYLLVKCTLYIYVQREAKFGNFPTDASETTKYQMCENQLSFSRLVACGKTGRQKKSENFFLFGANFGSAVFRISDSCSVETWVVSGG